MERSRAADETKLGEALNKSFLASDPPASTVENGIGGGTATSPTHLPYDARTKTKNQIVGARNEKER